MFPGSKTPTTAAPSVSEGGSSGVTGVVEEVLETKRGLVVMLKGHDVVRDTD